jgi:hypothetical protein
MSTCGSPEWKLQIIQKFTYAKKKFKKKKKKKNKHGKEANKQPSKECPPQSKT